MRLLLRFVLALCCLTVFSASLAAEVDEPGSRVIRFGTAGTAVNEDHWLSDGSVYSADRGFGWDVDLKHQARDRGDGCTGVALIDRDITRATFTVDIADGDYVFEITLGDSQFYSGGLVLVDGDPSAEPLALAAGKTAVVLVPVASRGGKAAIAFEGGLNSVRNAFIRSIVITPASADPARFARVQETVRDYQQQVRQARADRIARTAKQRAAYKPFQITDQRKPRQTLDLSGKWLFSPISEAGNAPQALQSPDKDWHVMHVPDFWKPIEWWIYMEGNGTSQNFYRKELDRCKALTFDYKTTSAGWYRQWIEVPASMRGRRLVVRFDAAATIAEVYWNGKRVGSHIGMFGPFECEVTPNVEFGAKNLLAVFVSAGQVDPKFTKNGHAVAVTVNITQEMLNSLPHGWYKTGMAGIWQPVSLTVTGPSRIQDVVFRPRLDGAEIITSVSARSGVRISHSIGDAVTGALIYKGKPQSVSGLRSAIDTGLLHPKLWSPEHPNLYVLKTRLYSGSKLVDEVSTTVGFKTFEARGNRLYLNGKPYFIRGADMPPHGLRPNDKALADKFMKMMHDGNTMATRFHIAPPSKIWLNAADKYGVGASVGENWPWILMGDTPIPDRKLIEVWHRDFIEVVRAYRNHPSMMLWTISNESYFEGDPDLKRRVEKYRIFSDLIKDVRKEDPQTPIVFHSGHVRRENELRMLADNNFDDGDVDDPHFYLGWYNRSPFNMSVATDVESKGMGKRPMLSQEASTGYPDNDTGHPVLSYITQHGVPQAWVGSHALYTARPDMFLETHGVITKEYAERIRRERTWLSGWMLFANCCWFRDVYDAQSIAPYPAYWGVQKAYEPVLVSLESPNRHFVAGQKFASEVWVCNDDPDRPMLKDLSLVWTLRDKSNTQTSGRARLPDCAYDKRSHAAVEFRAPQSLATSRANVKLEMELYSGDERVSRNSYDLICADDEFCTRDCGSAIVLENETKTSQYLASCGARCDSRRVVDWAALPRTAVVVVAPDADKTALGSALDFGDFVKDGGTVLMVSPRGSDSALSMIPEFDPGKVSAVDTLGDFVEPLVPELLDGLDPMDMHWWNAEKGGIVQVCRFAYKLPEAGGVKLLARHIQPHGYIRNGREVTDYTSWPAFEVKRGSGSVVVASMNLADDPIARRFWGNLLTFIGK